MGYRHYLYAIPKEQVKEIQECVTNNDWILFGARHSYADERVLGDEDEWLPVYKVGKELYELGKYYELGGAFESQRQKLFTSKELQEKYVDYGFVLLTKEDFAAIIDDYRKKVVNYYHSLLYPEQEEPIIPSKLTKEERWKTVIEDKMETWQCKFGLCPYNIELDKPQITDSWEYEYAIFELVRLYKSFDWDNDNLVLIGW